MGSCLRGLGDVAIKRGQEEQGARLWGAAAALHEAIGADSAETGELDHGSAFAAADKSLCPAMAAWEGGRTLIPEEAVAEGLATAAMLSWGTTSGRSSPSAGTSRCAHLHVKR
jgi:hypothetical protein